MDPTFIKESFIVNPVRESGIEPPSIGNNPYHRQGSVAFSNGVDKYFRFVAMLLGTTIIFCGCANLSGQNAPELDDADMSSTSFEQSETGSATGKDQRAKASYRFTDVPVPSKFKLDRGNSFTYEAGSFKAGIITYNGWSKLDTLVDFYKKEMPAFEWEMVSIFEHNDITIVYSKEGWNCAINLSSSNLGGSKIRIQIGPINTP